MRNAKASKKSPNIIAKILKQNTFLTAELFLPFLAESAGEWSLLGVASMVGAQLILASKPFLTMTTTQPEQ